VVASIFESYLSIFLSALRSEIALDLSFFEHMHFLFDYDSLLHTCNYQVSEEQIKHIRL